VAPVGHADGVVDRPVLLTGASGLLGHWLLRTIPSNRAVVGLVHRRSAPNVPTVHADLLDEAALRTAVGRVRPSLIVHAAYARDHASIVNATQHVVQAASEVEAEVVFISSDAVFAGDGIGRDEDAVPAPTWEYGRWKAAAENSVMAEASRNSIVRLPLVVSVDPDDQAVQRIRAGAARAETTLWFSDEVRQPARAEDLARAIWRIASLDSDVRVGNWHLPGPESLSRHDIALRIVATLGLDPRVIGEERTPPDSDRPRHLHMLDRRARREIGWSPSRAFA
jgi:dTDP-4-dehydrorhamnose reductase